MTIKEDQTNFQLLAQMQLDLLTMKQTLISCTNVLVSLERGSDVVKMPRAVWKVIRENIEIAEVALIISPCPISKKVVDLCKDHLKDAQSATAGSGLNLAVDILKLLGVDYKE